MKTKLLAAAAAAVAVLTVAGGASATITITFAPDAAGDTALDNGVADGAHLTNPLVSNQIMIDNFGDNNGQLGPIAGFTMNPNGLGPTGSPTSYIRVGTNPGTLLGSESAPPPIFNAADPNSPLYETGNYYTVTSDCTGQASPGCGHTATLTVDKGYLTSFSFYLGSPDTFNTINFYDASGLVASKSGVAIWGGTPGQDNGFQGFGARAIYDFGGAHITSISFQSTGGGASNNSFEFDNLAGTIGGVPEPASWALMIVGFGAAGAMLRGKRRSALTA